MTPPHNSLHSENILDQPLTNPVKPKVRTIFVGILDAFILIYTLILYVVALLHFAYSIYDEKNAYANSVKILCILLAGICLGLFYSSILTFIRDWYRASSKHDATTNIDLLKKFYLQTQSPLIPDSENFKTLAAQVRYSSLLIFIFSVGMLFTVWQKPEASIWTYISFIGLATHSILTTVYCFIIQKVLQLFLTKQSKAQ